MLRRVGILERYERQVVVGLTFLVWAIVMWTLVFATGCAPTGDSMHIRTRAGYEYRQCSLPQIYAISDNVPTHFDDGIRDGFDYWNAVAGRKLFVYAGHVHSAPNDPESSAMVVVGYPTMDHTDASVTEVDDHGIERVQNSKLASADIIADPFGCITRASVWMKAAMDDTQSDESVFNVFAHESGHILGLTHNPMGGGLMHAYWAPFGKGEASPEEKAAIWSMYGHGQQSEVLR